MLGDQPWFFGEAPTLTDAVVYGLLANFRFVGFSSPVKEIIADCPNLVAFLDRFRARYYPDAVLTA